MANRNTVHLSDDQICDLKDVFTHLDDDGNGKISLDELGPALELVGIRAAGWELRQIMAKYDTSGDGCIDMQEFRSLYMSEKGSRDIGVFFKKAVTTRKDINTMGGTSHASVEGTTHTVKTAETAAFSQWINSNLCEDLDCKPSLPINSEKNELFEKCKTGILLCKLINKSSEGTIDERTINKTNLSVYRRHENLTLAITSAQSIGCSVVNIGPDDLDTGKPHLVLGLLWQIIRIGLLSDINLAHHPGLIHLLEDDETLEDLQKLSPEQILIRWVNYHMRKAGRDRRIANFSEDIKDSEVYTYLLHQIAPKTLDDPVTLQPLSVCDLKTRAECMLKEAEKIDCRSFVEPPDVVGGNSKLNMAFVANLFNCYPALEKVDEDVELNILEETREEKTYRNWMNSMGVSPYVHYIYNDLTDGLVIFQLFDICKPGVVDWKRVHKKFNKLKIKYEKIENCNYACELGLKLVFSLVGVAGSDIHAGNPTLILALVWQLMRAYTISILSGLSENSKNPEKEIVAWANFRLDKSARFSSFSDSNLSDSIILIKLIEKIKPAAVDWKVVLTGATTSEDKLANARYAIGIARKMGAKVYALPEDIVEMKHKMIMTIFACLMARDTSQNGQQLTQSHMA